jgi:hypothetical protein
MLLLAVVESCCRMLCYELSFLSEYLGMRWLDLRSISISIYSFIFFICTIYDLRVAYFYM